MAAATSRGFGWWTSRTTWHQPNMSATNDKKYGNLSLLRGGAVRTPNRIQPGYIDWQLDTEMQSLFAAWCSEEGIVPSRSVYDIRTGQQRPWRYLVKRFREARVAGVPKAEVVAVVRALEAFVGSLYDERAKGAA